ncbi:MAG: RNA polymerase factor sigma-54 [Gammaproteobacteria bacterium]|nr:RNA polymerase factor sigma-54 [Gammaproteobacteria bacterium]MCF6259781.1 RNA polymerase factor sigma-54 [Gammaproteobacteria bacterium]
MKQTLQLKLGQHLTMTPQLQQAIRLLQLSTLELQTEIQEALESNPMLEVTEEAAAERRENDSGERNDGEASTTADSTSGENRIENRSEDGENIDVADRAVDKQEQEIPNDLPTDSEWEDSYSDTYVDSYSSVSRNNNDSENLSYEQADSSSESLQDHLLWQLNLSSCSETDQAIATTIIDAVDDDGYLSTSLEELHQSLSEGNDIELDEVEAVLHRVQNFDPPGIAARDLRECMLIQLKYYDAETPWLTEAKVLLREHFDSLAKREYPLIMRRMKLAETQMQHVIQLVQSLNPRPGGHITESQPEYIIPDVFVKKIKGQWRVELNPDITPKIGINSLYAKMAQRNNSKDATFLKNNLQEARWFIKSLRSRNETLLKVATTIVDRQRGFFDHGEEAMKPMVMHDIAEIVEMHESTISRVTTKKYMHTPRGIFELKFFFSSHVGTTTGGECSATAIRAILKKLIAAEKPGKPLSDNKLAGLLGDQGINVARRTVAKYREAMSIAPSNERKRLV